MTGVPKTDAKKEDLGIIPRLKKVHPEKVEESPLERLKKLENGEILLNSPFLMHTHFVTTAFEIKS